MHFTIFTRIHTAIPASTIHTVIPTSTTMLTTIMPIAMRTNNSNSTYYYDTHCF